MNGKSNSLVTGVCTDVVKRIAGKVTRGERISGEEAATLWYEAPLALLGMLATDCRDRKSGRVVYYNRNFHIEPTNLCVFNCRFCSYRRSAGSPEAWDYSLEEIEAIARKYVDSPVTEVHIVGGVHPSRDLYEYAELIRRVKAILPQVTVKAFTAIELAYMIDRVGLTYEEGLTLLKEAGMEAVPGGGAEIFDEELRARICPEKGSTEQWLTIHRIAHQIGLKSNATMLYGHVESPGQRIDHLERLRCLQDETGGFDAFIPLKYRCAGNGLSAAGETGITDDMRTLALSRIYLDNFPHIKAYWVMYGKVAAEMALSFGADDLDGTIDETTRIYSMAGAEEKKPRLTISEIERMALAAGVKAVERDTFYRPVLADEH